MTTDPRDREQAEALLPEFRNSSKIDEIAAALARARAEGDIRGWRRGWAALAKYHDEVLRHDIRRAAFAEAANMARNKAARWPSCGRTLSELGDEFAALASAPKEQRQGSHEIDAPARKVSKDGDVGSTNAGSTPAPGTPAPLDRAALVERARQFNIEDRGRAHGGLPSADTDRLLALMADFALAQIAPVAERAERAEAELADWRDSAARAASETCRGEKHCTCVGPLRAELARAREERDEARAMVSPGREAVRALAYGQAWEPPRAEAPKAEDERGCLNCGGEDITWREGSYPSGVTGPNGEQEILHEAGWVCADCGAVEDKLGPAARQARRTEGRA